MSDALTRLKLSGWMDDIHPMTITKKIVGRAATISFQPTRGTNNFTENFYSLISKCEKGNILVVGSLGVNVWLFGDNTVNYAIKKELSGLLVDGCIRDTDALLNIEFPIFCKGSSVRSFKTLIEISGFQETISCSGAQVKPRDIIVGDSDGIVVIPSEKLSEVIKQIKDIEFLEEEQAKLIDSNCSLDELNSLIKKKKIVKE